MSTSTRWHRLFRSLHYHQIPFPLAKSFKVTTNSNKEYVGNSAKEFEKMFLDLKQKGNTDYIISMQFELHHRKVRRTIEKTVDALFEKHLPTKIK